MNATDRFDDTLEPIGIGAGVLLVLVGLATIAGTPWTTNSDGLASAMQVGGALGAVAIGIGLVQLARIEGT